MLPRTRSPEPRLQEFPDLQVLPRTPSFRRESHRIRFLIDEKTRGLPDVENHAVSAAVLMSNLNRRRIRIGTRRTPVLQEFFRRIILARMLRRAAPHRVRFLIFFLLEQTEEL